jgi:uncharacterized protein (DUF1684 family)
MSFAELWDWRRRVAELYAAARAEADPQMAWLLWRERRDALYREHPQTPLDPEARAGFAGLPFFPYDPSLRFLVRLVPIEEAPEEQFGAGADGTVRLRPFARTDGLQARLGGELTLYWMLGYCGGVFLPFADATSGRETYGAGRYVLDTIKSADLGSAPDGRAILDFNFAYNPSCAYSVRWACPLAPAANRLPEPVRAGEKSPEQLHGPV